jgi:hypothetical protein
MSEKRKSTPPSAIQVKNRQKIISTEEKLDVMNEPVKGERIDDIQKSAKSGSNVSAKTTTYSRSSTMERTEKVLST